MTDTVDVLDRDAFSLLLRSKTAMGRLVESEVNSVLDFLESVGFTHQAAQPEPVPAEVVPVPEVVQAEVVPIVIAAPPPDVAPAPIAPPPAQ